MHWSQSRGPSTLKETRELYIDKMSVAIKEFIKRIFISPIMVAKTTTKTKKKKGNINIELIQQINFKYRYRLC
jgi:hypothetical protein